METARTELKDSDFFICSKCRMMRLKKSEANPYGWDVNQAVKHGWSFCYAAGEVPRSPIIRCEGCTLRHRSFNIARWVLGFPFMLLGELVVLAGLFIAFGIGPVKYECKRFFSL